MPDVLSQEEIDSLLSALSTGEVDAEEIKQTEGRNVRDYDFRRPNKFSKDQMRTLQMLHEHFARMVTTSLSAQLRSFVSVSVASVDQMTYDEFIRSIPSPAIISIFHMDPLEGSAILEFDPDIGFVIIDRLFGGQGSSLQEHREITDIEETVIERLVVRLLRDYQETWEDIEEIEPELAEIETNPQFAQVVPESDIILLITLELKIEENEGLVNICIPHLVLEPILDELSSHYWFAGIKKKTTAQDIARLRRRVEKTRAPLVVEIGQNRLTVGEVMELERGDVIKLDTRIDEPLRVKVGNRIKFRGYPGVKRGHMAIRIERVQDEEEEGELIGE